MQEQIEEIVGARVVSLEHVEGRGYTHARRQRAFLADGRTVFVKSAVDELSAGWLNAEIAVYSSVRGAFLARFHGSAEHDGLPPPATGPRVRIVQREQLTVALPWACRALGLPAPG